MKIEIGDQADCVFFQGVVAKKNRHFDVIVDDRGHKMHQQKTSFNTLWSQFADGGLYLMEDTHSGYWLGFGGGFQEKNSFIDYSMDLVDRMQSCYTD